MKAIASVAVATAALVGASLLFGQQPSPPVSSSRWQVAAGSKDTILVDTVAGETWALSHVSGYVNESPSHYDKWDPIVRLEPATQPSSGGCRYHRSKSVFCRPGY